VARACALNRVALVVPCHRIVGATGSLTGYRWGVERKRMLLEAESRTIIAKEDSNASYRRAPPDA
jgi:AraC family transcriptional regulator of adaptative response/methylated-DNA-[protein]-cysteine methyltransferase